MLVVLQRQLARNTPEKINSVRNHREQWVLFLHILDGLSSKQASTVEHQIHTEDSGIDFQIISRQARLLLEGDYLDLLKIPDDH